MFSKVKARLGLQHVKFAFTGAAPIQVQTLEYFGSLGIQINEVYGMSECTGACTWSTDQTHIWGSCGFALPGVEIKVFTTEGAGGKKEWCVLGRRLWLLLSLVCVCVFVFLCVCVCARAGVRVHARAFVRVCVYVYLPGTWRKNATR